MTVGGSGDNCPSCGSSLAADQRYCLVCGHRRGDPRLPFMDAVVFMEAINQPKNPPPPPPPHDDRPRGISANTALIAGIATLVLAIGVGVLIGRSGNSGTTSAANTTPQIIQVGGGAETTTPTESKKEAGQGGGKAKAKGAKKGKSKKAEEKSETGETGQTKATEEILEPKVPQAKPEAQLGETCTKGTAGCSSNGKFEGEFFGE